MTPFLFRIVPKVTQNATVGRVFADIESSVIEGLAHESFSSQSLAGILITPIIIDPGVGGTFQDVFSFKRGSASVIAGRNIDFYNWRFAPKELREVMARDNILDTLKSIPSKYVTGDLLNLLIRFVAESRSD